MSDRDRTKTDLQKELERLRKRIAELESRGAGDRRGEELEIREQAIRSSINGIALSDINGMLTFVNPSFLAMWGYEDAREVLGRPAASFWESGEQAERIIQALGERGGWVGEMTAKRKNGDRFPVQLSAAIIKGRTGTPVGMMGSFLDITERKQAEASMRNVARLYAFLSQINQAIVRIRDRDELFRTICRVAVEFGQFRMAWVGLIDEAAGIVRPFAHAGQEEGYLNVLSIRISDETTGRGPTGSALRGGALAICDDIATDPRMLPWREEALKRGYRSSAAIPFRLKEKVIASLNLYAAEPGFFTEDERKLLKEIGIDISFALDTMENETDRERTEAALRESEEHLNYMMSNSPAVIYTCRPSGNFGATFVSENVVHQLGYEASAFIADPGFWTAQIHPEDKQRIFDGLAALFAEGSHTHEYRFLHKDGAWRWMHDELKLIRNAAGEPVEILGSWVDITDRKLTEEALRKSEEKYRTFFDSATDAAIILDLDGNIIDVNRTAYTRLGYTKQEMLSMNVSRLDPPAFAARVPERLAQISRSGVAVFESAHLRKDGSVMPVEINSRLLDYEGRQVYFSIVRDITDRKRAEEALRESEERFRTLLARVDSVAVQGFGPDGVIHYWNKASERLYGYTAEEAQGRTILDLIVPPDTRELVVSSFAQMAESGTPLPSSEASLLRKDGGRVTVYANYAVVSMPGCAPELYCIDIDITDRRRAEQERLELERRLLHAQKLESLGILAGGIAHDFNNLLMAVLGNLDLALRKVSPLSPARLNIEQSAQAARRATDLTRQMLAYSGKGRFIVKALDLNELVEENTHLLRASVARTATLDVRLGRSLPSIEADAGQVQQVIMNLITNASEAIGDSSGRIIITTGVQECDAQCLKRSQIEDVPPAGRFVYLEVLDTGCGMDEQTQARLFDPFFTTKAPGRGLGMSAILGIVRGHGGAIFVESGPGKGTAIRILFPASEGAQTERVAAAGARDAEAGAPAVSGTVLVVDDEEIVRRVCREMVEAMGLQVLTAVDGRDAVDVFNRRADSISHVILDLSMPNMDGMTAFQELVRIRPGVKVILSSGYDEQDSLQRLSGPGPAGFIQKPYSLQNLRDALEKAGAAGE